MQTFKQKALALLTAVCMIATSAAPALAAGTNSAAVTDSGTVQVTTWPTGVTRVEVLDSGASSAAATLTTSQDTASVPVGNYKVKVTTENDTTVTGIKVGSDLGVTGSGTTYTSQNSFAVADGQTYTIEITTSGSGEDPTPTPPGDKTVTKAEFKGHAGKTNVDVDAGTVGNITSGYAKDEVETTLSAAYQLSLTVNSTAEEAAITNWNAAPVYDDAAPGDYVFTPGLPTGYQLDTDVMLPTVTVKIAAPPQPGDKVFNEAQTLTPIKIDTDEHIVTWTALKAKLLQQVEIYAVDTTTATVGVTWEELTDFNGAQKTYTVNGTFTLPDGWNNSGNKELTVSQTVEIAVAQTAVETDTPIDAVNLTIDPAPVLGAKVADVKVTSDTNWVTVEKTWTPNDETFGAKEYTMDVRLTAKEGYTFKYDTQIGVNVGTKGSVTRPAQNTMAFSVTFKVAAEYTVTFDPMNGTEEKTVTVTGGQKVAKPVDPKKDGHTFLGWFVNQDPFDFNTPITSNIEVYAKWIADTIPDQIKDPDTVNDAIQAIENAAGTNPEARAQALEKVAMEAGTTVIAIEKIYAKANGIEPKGKSNTNKVTGTLTVEGGALNVLFGASDKTVEIQVGDGDMTDAEAIVKVQNELNMEALKTVVLDFSLYVSGKKMSKSVTALKIASPYPIGINAENRFNLLLLHYKNGINSKPEIVRNAQFNSKGFEFEVADFSNFVLVETATTYNPSPDYRPSGSGSSSGGGGGGGGGGSSGGQSLFDKTTNNINNILKGLLGGKTTTTTTTGATAAGTVAVAGTPVTTAVATKAADTAISQAKANGSSSANVIVRNASTVSPAVFEAIAAQAQKSGLKAYMAADTMKNGIVDVRVSVLASAASRLGKDLNLYAVCGNKAVENHFAKYFQNKVAVVSMSQQGAFGVPVSVAAKANLNGMNPQNLHIYSYDATGNSYRELPQEACFVDSNGYLHFITDVGGYIVISDGTLQLH